MVNAPTISGAMPRLTEHGRRYRLSDSANIYVPSLKEAGCEAMVARGGCRSCLEMMIPDLQRKPLTVFMLAF